MGWLSGVIFKALWKIDKTKTVSFFVTGLLGAFMNTLFFMSTLMICFGHTEYLQSMNATGANLFMFAVAFCRWWRCEGSQRSTEEECSDRRAVIESEIYRNEK
jgi:uncharacterized membrane protein YqjE